MARVFYDTFTKEDGPVGAEYTVLSGNFAYSGNALHATTAGYVLPTILDPLENASQYAVVNTPSSFTRSFTFKFRGSQDDADNITASFSLQATQIVVTINEKVGGSSTTLVTRTHPYTWGTSVELQASVFNETCVVWIDGFEIVSTRVANVTGAGITPMFLGLSQPYVDYWAIYEYSTVGYSVSVDSGPDENGYYTLTLHNAGREWTPGTPGSPVFTAQAGTVISQEVTDVDTAEIVWEPASLWAEELINDPLNGYSVPFGISAPPGETGPSGGGGALTETQAETLADLSTYLGDYQDGPAPTRNVFIELGILSLALSEGYNSSPNPAVNDLLDAILGTENGLAAIKNRVDLIHTLADDLTGSGTYSLSGVQEVLRGTSSRDLTQVYNLIAGLTPADQTDVTEILNAIAAIRTGNLWTLDSVKTWIEAIDVGDNADVLNELTLIRTANAWTLGHVMDAIAAITIPDYSTDLEDLADAVDAIPTNPITDLSSVLTAISNVRGSGNPDLAALLTAINARPTNPITSLQSVLDAISTLSSLLESKVELILDAIAAIASALGPSQSPVWPGIGNVTLGDPINLAQTFAYSGACDGVLVAITSDPNNHGVYGWGSVTQYPRAGYISFVSDNGDYSDVQPFSFPTNLISVTGMLHADGFIGRARPGATGTVTPWTITVP